MRRRVILPNRQTLANDVNEITSNMLYNMNVVNDGIIGASKGVISGLDVTSIANTSTVFTFPTGIVSDGNGVFYELLTQTPFTMSGGSGTYKAYVQYCTIDDTPVSGWTLLDVITRTESNTTVNTRTYDGLTGNVTVGTVASNAEHVANVVWNGTAITSITDARTLVTIASLPAYTLQGFVTTDANFATIENKVSGTILEDSDTNSVRFTKSTIANGHQGIGHEVIVGQHAGAKGFKAVVSGNVGFHSDNLIPTSSGFVSLGTSDTGHGFIAKDNARGYVATSNATGFVSSNNALGMEITDCTNQLRFKPLSATPTNGTEGEIAIVDEGSISAMKFHNGLNFSKLSTFEWAISSGNATFATDTGIIAAKPTLLTYALPTTSSTGQVVRMAGASAGLWKISQAANQKIYFNDQSTTTGTGGYLASTLSFNAVELLCITANLEWMVISSVGNITVV